MAAGVAIQDFQSDLTTSEIPTLFDTDSENDSVEEDGSQLEEVFETKLVPLNDMITRVPSTYSQFLEVVLPRLQPNDNLKELSTEDQQSLAQILIGELASQFSIMQHQIDDPFLSANDNKELHRLIFVEVASTLEMLYSSYLIKAINLNAETILSESAQMSRLRAELVVAANKRISAPLIRRKVLSKFHPSSPTLHHSIIKQSQSSSQYDNLDNQLKEIKLNFPKMKLPVREVNSQLLLKESESAGVNEQSISSGNKNVSSGNKIVSSGTEPVVQLGQSYSQPAISKDTLLYELDMEPTDEKTKFLGLWESPSVDILKEVKLSGHSRSSGITNVNLGEYTDEMLREDVENLAKQEVIVSPQPQNNDMEDTLDDLTPLLAVHTSVKRHHAPVVTEEDTTISHDVIKSSPPLKEAVSPPQFSFKSPSSVSSPIQSEMPNNFSSSSFLGLSQNSNSFNGSEQNITPQQSENDDINEMDNIESPQSQDSTFSNVQLHSTNSIPNEQLHKEASPDKTDNIVPQPDTLTLSIPYQKTAKLSDFCVSDRSPIFSLRLQPYSTIYNELTEDMDNSTVEQLDSNLREGDDIKKVYMELAQTFSKDHLDFEKDPALHPSIEEKINLISIYSSNSLHHRKKRRIINRLLTHAGFPPWHGSSRREWLTSDVATEQNCMSSKISMQTLKKQLAQKSKLSVDDYLKHVASNGSDYLAAIHHMYDSSGSDSEDEQQEREKRRKMQELHEQLLAKERRRLELLQQKSLFVPGQWNVNTVLMGGLGNDPDEIQEENATANIDWPSVQLRLHNIWQQLHITEDEQINMAIQFSNPKFALQVPQVLNLWEKCCEIVESREHALKVLETFEMFASDPKRHFNKAPSSLTRLREAKERSALHQTLDDIDKQVIVAAKELIKYGSTLTYKGRNYLEKIQMDRVELLYFLHQQRRQIILQPAIQLLNDNIK